MNRTLIIYDNVLAQTEFIDLFQKVLGPSTSLQISDFNSNLEGYSHIALIIDIDSNLVTMYIQNSKISAIEGKAKEMKQNLITEDPYFSNKNSLSFREFKTNTHELANRTSTELDLRAMNFLKLKEYYLSRIFQKPSAVFFVCHKENDIQIANKLIDYFIMNYSEQILYSDYIIYMDDSHIQKQELAYKLIKLKRNLLDYSDMPSEVLEKEIKQIFYSHNTCSLTTGFSEGISTNLRTTPIEYTYYHDLFYFLSEGGEKFANLYANPNVAISVYNEYQDFKTIEGIQLEGTAKMVELYSKEYMEIISEKGLDTAHIRSLPVPLHMFKVKPERIQVLKSDFRKLGYDVRQILE